MKLSIAISAVVVLIAAGSAVAAPPHPEVGNFVTLNLGPNVGEFRGAVHGQVVDCVVNRKVRIVRVSGNDTRVGVGFTDERGHFDIQTSESSGDWIAKIKKLDIGHGYHCAGDRSSIKSAG